MRVVFPPVEFDEPGKACASEQSAIAERRDADRVVGIDDPLKRRQVAVIVVIMA